MALHAETDQFIRDLERFSNRKLSYPGDVGHFLEAARQSQKMSVFEEAIFLSKFVTKSLAVMRRIGTDGEGYDKLSSEFQANLQKTASLLKTLREGMPDEVKRNQENLFFSLTQDSLDRFVKLVADLALVKNWVLDGKPLPGRSTDGR